MANTGHCPVTPPRQTRFRRNGLPFLIAWGCKALTLRYGGLTLYRRLLPLFLGLFLGLILGGFLAGGFWTLVGCFTDLNIYPMNW